MCNNFQAVAHHPESTKLELVVQIQERILELMTQRRMMINTVNMARIAAFKKANTTMSLELLKSTWSIIIAAFL